MKKILICLVLSFLLITQVKAATYAWTEKYCDPSLGASVDDTDGDGSSGTPWEGIQYALDQIIAGQRLNVKATTVTLAAALDCDATAGTTSAPIMVRGYTTSIGDGGDIILDADSAAANALAVAQPYWIFQDVTMRNSTGDAITFNATGDAGLVYRCVFDGTIGDSAIYAAGSSIFHRSIYNYIAGTTGDAIFYDDDPNGGDAFYNYIVNAGSEAIEGDGTATLIGNIINNPTNDGIYFDRTTFSFFNTIYSAGDDGIDSANSGDTIFNNIFNDNTVGIEISTGVILDFGNVFEGNTADYDAEAQISIREDQSTTDPAFSPPDFDPAAGLKGSQFPDSWAGATGTSNSGGFSGAVQIDDAGGAVQDVFGWVD